RDGGAGGRRRQAGTRRRLRPLGMGSTRLLRFHRAYLRARDSALLRARTALGKRRTGGAVRAACDALLTVVLAPPCAACGTLLEHPTSGPVCERCWRSIHFLTPPVCDACGDPLPTWHADNGSPERCVRCRTTRRAVDRARAVGAYEGAL